MSDFRSKKHQFGGGTGPLVKGGAKPKGKYWNKPPISPVKSIPLSTWIKRENRGIPKGKTRKG